MTTSEEWAAGKLSAPPEALDFSPIEKIAASAAVDAKDIGISFFSHRTRKSTQLVGNSDPENFIKARKGWLSFDFTEIVFVTSIDVFASGYEDYHEMELSYEELITKREQHDKAKYNKDHFHFPINRFLAGFGLSPSERLFKDAKLTKITVKGIEQKYISEVAAIASNLQREKERIEAELTSYLTRATAAHKRTSDQEEIIASQEQTIEENKEEIQSTSDALEKNRAALTQVQQKIEIGTSVEKEQNERVQSIKLNIDRLNDERSKINADIASKQAILTDLQSNINLFPTEISGYVKQGTNNIRLYAVLSVIPLLIICALTAKLFSNSERLLDYFVDGKSVGIIEFLISRVPYVIVSAVILAICYTLLHRLISEIVNINRRRQDLFKISIIATDVSYASQDGMDLAPEERYNLKTQTKIEMLKEHLKQHMGEDYVYQPRHTFMTKLLSVIGRQASEEEKSPD